VGAKEMKEGGGWGEGYERAPPPATSPAHTSGDRQEALRKEAELAADMGFEARYVEAVPFVGTPGIEYGGQAKFHPRKSLAPLRHAIEGDGSFVFEHTESTEIADDPLTVRANDHT